MHVLDTQQINELINILEQEARVYEAVFKLSKNKTSVIVEGKVSELENMVKLEQSLVIQIGRLENLRESVAGALAEKLGMKNTELTLSELAKHLKGEQGNKLTEVQSRISGTLDELKGSNELNSRLIKNSLDFINFSINMIASVDTGTNNYGLNGQVNDTKKRNFFDMKL